mmetsp:Transcript_17517/g.25079  ORF Transcript_17517/g.25079 Transcript_17517/m.25079 type:complete len:865 (-) Transcript_17517:422-3016(-)
MFRLARQTACFNRSSSSRRFQQTKGIQCMSPKQTRSSSCDDIWKRSIGRAMTSSSIGVTPTSTNSHHRQIHSSSSPFRDAILSTEEEIIKPPPPPAFQKLLIANRGEIALRIIRTAHALSIPTVAIHSTIDSNSLHVQHATESVCIGPPSSSESYLNMDAVCDAILSTGADAVHPGYGFLSENAEFARRIQEMNNVAFLGPSPTAITAMGDKIQSKRIAREAGVNVIPGFDGVLQSPQEAVQVAKEVGFPVMMKAAGGGGGKGMRICYDEQEVIDTYPLCKAEAINFFKDERIFIERYIENPHHIEIQLLAGSKKSSTSPKGIPVTNPFPIMDGMKEYEELQILCFPERECSIQRRNQKILEESPSVLLSPEIRAEMIKQVKSLVRTVNYTSAGTVEFLVEDDGSDFYFLEMNTRLQVEHPVTEMITGVDLVRGMIDVAAGRGIPQEYLDLVYKDGDSEEDLEGKVVPHCGHAIEARIYAEDPLRGFLPSTGPLLQYEEPPSSILISSSGQKEEQCQIRVDSGVTVGQTITQYYDPLISKLISYSPNDRSQAIAGLSKACDLYVIEGLGGGNNVNFVQDVLRQPSFQRGDTPTNFIDMHYPDGFDGVILTKEELEEVSVIGALLGEQRRHVLDYPPLTLVGEEMKKDCQEKDGKEEKVVVVCLGGMFGKAYEVSIGKDLKTMAVKSLSPFSSKEEENEGKEEDMEKKTSKVTVDQLSFHPNDTIAEVTVNGVNRAVQVGVEDNTGLFAIKMYGAKVDILVMSPAEYELSKYMNEPAVVDTCNLLLSPMPGTLISYAVKEGDHVVEGQELCIVEAMKMQNILRSARSGVIGKCIGVVGSSVHADEIILEFSSEEQGEEEENELQQ